MKRYLISAVVILAVLAAAWVVFAQDQPVRPRGGARRFGFLSPEEQQKAVETIEQQVTKLKEALKAQPTRPENFQNLSDEERTKFMDQMRKAGEERQTAIRTIIAELAKLQGRVQPQAEGEQFIIVNTADLKDVQKIAEEEKATKTAERITMMIESGQRGRGMGRRLGAPGERPDRPGRSERAPTTPPTPPIPPQEEEKP
jgi:hypothetical protein